MIEHKISHFIVKHGHFLTLGLNTLINYSCVKSFELYYATGLSSDFILGVATSLSGVSIITGFLSLIGLSRKGGIVGELVGGVIESMNEKFSKNIYRKYNTKTFYSQAESEEQELVKSFTKTLAVAASLDLLQELTPRINEDLSQTCINNAVIKEIYLKESLNQNTHALANLFKYALKHVESSTNYYLNIAKIFLTIEPQFTQADQEVFTKLLKKINKDTINNKVIEYLSQKKVFLLFNEENQRLFLENLGQRIQNRDELIESINEKTNSVSNEIEDEAKPIVIKSEPLQINQLSSQNFNQFKQNCQTLYDNQTSNLEPLLDKIEELLLFKEKVLGFMKHSTGTNVEVEFFLTQDVDKIIHNFNREINILHKMKHLSHPDLEMNKELVISKMSDRIDLIIDKMTEHLKTLHQSLTDDLSIESEVNHKVLKCKM